MRSAPSGSAKVAEAWSKVSERYADQRPPTAREVHRVLVEEGYRPKVGQVSGDEVDFITTGDVDVALHSR